MLQWIKDWAPILGTIGALLGVIITVGRARNTYTHGLIEKRKDHQRELIADLIANTRQWCDGAEIVNMAICKMTATDLIEYADTDSVRNQGELAKAVRIGLIKSLCEIGDSRILPLVAELELQYRGVMEGDDAAPLFNPNAAGEARFAALKIVLQRIWAVARTCSKLQIAAIEALQVEIDSIPFRRRLWNWLRGANVVKAEAIVKHY